MWEEATCKSDLEKIFRGAVAVSWQVQLGELPTEGRQLAEDLTRANEVLPGVNVKCQKHEPGFIQLAPTI